MYCRACYYDLRGQVALRCPECGRGFDPDDPGSFLYRPGRFRGLWNEIKECRTAFVIMLTCGWVLCMLFVLPELNARTRGHSRGPVISHLRMITIQRILWQRDDPKNRNYDRQAAVRDLPALLSPHTEQTKIKCRKYLSRAKAVAPYYLIPTAIYALLLIPLVQRRWRWIALGLLVTCVVLVPASRNGFEIADALLPEGFSLKPTHAYLDDYVHIDDVDMVTSKGKPSRIIAAYVLQSFEGDQLRIIAFSDSHVEQLQDDEAMPLFEAQGLEYPASTKSGAGE